MITLGDKVLALCEHAERELLLVAPFVKVNVLERMLSATANHVLVHCVTRWRPDEIVAGVSDLEIWPLLKERKAAKLSLRPNLHAKFYRTENDCLIGSANLTAAALGWSPISNLELLVSLPIQSPEVIDFELTLLRGSVEVDDSIFEQILNAVALLSAETPKLSGSTSEPKGNEFVPESLVLPDAWLPSLRNPEALFMAYIGRWEELTTASRDAALEDLAILNVPKELSKAAFEAYVGTLLLQQPIIRQVDAFVTTPQRFGAVTQLLESLPCNERLDFNADRAWQTLMRWLLYFLPMRYTVQQPRHSEIFSRLSTSKHQGNHVL